MSDHTSEETPKTTDIAFGRRKFIKQSVVSLGLTVHEYVKHRNAPSEKHESIPAIEKKTWLRPPGAAEEPDFLDRCTKCGDCIAACPYESIQVRAEDETPVIIAQDSPCYLCDDFPCVAVCESEALVPFDAACQVSMGLAVVSHKTCTSGQGCNACIPQCPVHALDMNFSNFQVEVKDDHCVGCGICEHVCKSVNDHIAIKIIPRSLIKTLR